MNKYAVFTLAVIAGLFVSNVAAVNTELKNVGSVAVDLHNGERDLSNALRITITPQGKAVVAENQPAGLDLCPTCISFVSQSINNLIQIIANGGIVGGCSALCGMLPNQTLGEVCALLCDIVGIDMFVKILSKVDLDPFYACELLTVCHPTEGGAANFTSFDVSPNPGHRDSEIDFSASLSVTKACGDGELIFAIQDPEGNIVGSGPVFGGLQPNVYSIDFQVKTEPSQQQGGEQWPEGDYVAELAVCQGECGSHHPHSEVYDVKTAKFSIQ